MESSLQRNKNNNSNPGSLPLITVISINYNSSISDVEKTITSVLNQTYNYIEYIVIDGQSTNGSIEKIRTFENSIDLIISEKDTGIYDAMNKGIRLAQGEWIVMMNMGDTFTEDKYLLDRIVKAGYLDKVGIVYGNTIIEKEHLKYIKIHHGHLTKNRVCGILKINHQSILSHRKIFESVGLFEDKRFKICADFYWLNKVFYTMGSSVFYKVDEVIAIYNEEGLSSSQESLIKMHREYSVLLKDFGSNYWIVLHEINFRVVQLKTFFYHRFKQFPKLYKIYRKLKYFRSNHISDIT